MIHYFILFFVCFFFGRSTLFYSDKKKYTILLIIMLLFGMWIRAEWNFLQLLNLNFLSENPSDSVKFSEW